MLWLVAGYYLLSINYLLVAIQVPFVELPNTISYMPILVGLMIEIFNFLELSLNLIFLICEGGRTCTFYHLLYTMLHPNHHPLVDIIHKSLSIFGSLIFKFFCNKVYSLE